MLFDAKSESISAGSLLNIKGQGNIIEHNK